jgi:hypothetical protein
MLYFSMRYFEFEVFEAVLLEEIRKFKGTVNYVCEFINP